jgi:uncharacterized protein YneF (UPF0154 family)
MRANEFAVFGKIYKKDSEDNDKIRDEMTRDMLRRIGPGHEELKVSEATPENQSHLGFIDGCYLSQRV